MAEADEIILQKMKADVLPVSVTRTLSSLNTSDVIDLLSATNKSLLKQTRDIIEKENLNGEVLNYCFNVEDLTEYKFKTSVARMFLVQLDAWRLASLPPSPSNMPISAPLSPVSIPQTQSPSHTLPHSPFTFTSPSTKSVPQSNTTTTSTATSSSEDQMLENLKNLKIHGYYSIEELMPMTFSIADTSLPSTASFQGLYSGYYVDHKKTQDRHRHQIKISTM